MFTAKLARLLSPKGLRKTRNLIKLEQESECMEGSKIKRNGGKKTKNKSKNGAMLRRKLRYNRETRFIIPRCCKNLYLKQGLVLLH